MSELRTTRNYPRGVTGRPGTVKSIQSGTIVITATNTGTATLSPAVDPASSQMHWLGSSDSLNTAQGDNYVPSLVLTNGTTVTATLHNSVSGHTVTIGWMVVEFWPGTFERIQRGETTISADPTDVTISEVDLNRAVLHIVSHQRIGTANLGNAVPDASFLDSTTIRFNTGGAQASQEMSWEVWEYPL